MFRPFRLIMIAALGLGIYAGFFQTPKDPHVPGAFDADKAAAFELESWKALKAHSDFGYYFNLVQRLREVHRYTWWKAAAQGFYLSRATTTFAEMHNRFERALPDLEDAAATEQSWTGIPFKPAAVARTQLDWWATRKMPGLDGDDHVAELMANDLAMRYGVGQDRVSGAALPLAMALRLRDEGGDAPDWTTIQKLLNDSFRNLKAGLTRRAAY
jgi:hypothetical protein